MIDRLSPPGSSSAALAVDHVGPASIAATEAEDHPCAVVVSAANGLPPGTELRILASPFRAVLDSDCHDQIHLAGVVPSVENVPIEVLRRPPATIDEIFAALALPRISVLELALPAGCPPGCAIRADLGLRPSPHANIDVCLDVQVRATPDGEYQAVGERIAIRVVAGPAVALECRARRSESRVTLSVFARDAYANVADSYSGRVELRGDAPGLPRTIDVQHGHAVVELDGPAPAGPLRIEAHDVERGWTAVSPPLLPWMPYFGELHFHTSFSGDGGGDLAAAYTYARDVLQLDLIGVTDHMPVEHWDATLRIDDAFDETDRFAVLPSWEWSTAHGHANVYLRSAGVDAGPRRFAEAAHPGDLEWPPDTFIVPHHTNIDSTYDEPDRDDVEPKWFEYDWSKKNPAIRLVEVAQCRGNFEADEVDPAWGIVTGGIGASVQDALEQGYRIGFIGGTDNHSSAPTRDSLKPGSYAGLTAVYADELSRTGIWDALWSRRTYATSGVPIVGRVRIAGADMGSETQMPGAVLLDADLHGTAAIERIDVIGDRRVVWSLSPGELDVELRDVRLPESRSYYVRLRQEDGHRAWFSPVWVDRG
jgi:hypothetical protein